MNVTIHVGDCREVMSVLADASIDAIITDPPYGLGFMGKAWDKGVPGADFWQEMLRVAKPGAYLLSFGGARTFHRMASAIEDAGWEIRDTIMWLYGSGFPKSHNLGDGRGTALKPAHEPIIMARKPLVGTVAATVLAYGTGALNIDFCRIGNPVGRWPANVIHDGSEEVLAAFPDAPGQQGDLRQQDHAVPAGNVFGQYGPKRAHTARMENDKSAARFFYCAKASRADRNEGCDGIEEKPLNWSSGDQSPGTFQSPGTKRASANNHPTVKPTELMRYLCRLVTPPGGTILDPFCGSGSTGKAAVLEWCNFVGIDTEAEYADIARLRIAAAQATVPTNGAAA